MPALGQEWATTARAIATPNAVHLHWAAGFLEGEGTFGFRGATAAIHAAQTDNLGPLQKLLRFFGGSITPHKTESSRARGLRARDGAIWTVRGARARGVMMTIYCLMSPRRQEQIRHALAQAAVTTPFYRDHRPATTLTEAQRAEIRSHCNSKPGVRAMLAKEFGVSTQTIWRVVKGR